MIDNPVESLAALEVINEKCFYNIYMDEIQPIPDFVKDTPEDVASFIDYINA